jgi:agmatinase
MKMSREDAIKNFDPSGVGINNGNFIGLPFDEENAQIVLLPVPWDVTVSFTDGTSTGPQNILESSTQLDLFDPKVRDAWKMGIYFRKNDETLAAKGKVLRVKAKKYIEQLESGKSLDAKMKAILDEINEGCEAMNQWVEKNVLELINKGKLVGLIGGDHSTPLGYMRALAQKHKAFGVLHIDAHYDLRKAYEGFTYSHASVFRNASQLKQIKQFVHVGIRDYCQEEFDFVAASKGRNLVYSDNFIQGKTFKGHYFKNICEEMIASLPEKVYISFDIDGLLPYLCPNTGTPVPGGLEFNQAVYLIKRVVKSGRTIIGFDVVETAGTGNDWDGNVAARLVYKIANLAGKSGMLDV